MSTEQTSVVVLTPPGRGAVAVIAVDGPNALDFVDRSFHAKSGPLAERAINRIAYGRWGEEPAEDIIACRRGDQKVEVHCHGGAAAVERIVSDLTQAGAIEEQWPDWTSRIAPSPIRAAAQVALAEAVTERAAFVLLDQYHGALDRAVDATIALVASRQIEAATSEIESLLARASFGLHLTRPRQVVIAGPPNVGKSSLINSLVGYERSIVFDQPGTTRDVVATQTVLAGWPVQLADTAGLRASDDALEAAGVERAVSQAAAADCLVLVFDASRPWTAANDQLIAQWPSALVVQNKCDLSKAAGGLEVSALTGQGVANLIDRIVQRLVPVVPSAGEAVPFTHAQVQSLRLAANYLRQGDSTAAMDVLRGMLES